MNIYILTCIYCHSCISSSDSPISRIHSRFTHFNTFSIHEAPIYSTRCTSKLFGTSFPNIQLTFPPDRSHVQIRSRALGIVPHPHICHIWLTVFKDRSFDVADTVFRLDPATRCHYATTFSIARTIYNKNGWCYDLASPDGVTLHKEVHEKELHSLETFHPHL